MKIPLLDLKNQYKGIKSEIDAAIKKVVDAQDFILGEEVKNLETEMAVYCGVKYAVGVASGTDALILSLLALGIKPGDEVITTPFTFIATAEAASLLGAKPVFVDIEPETYNINADLIEKAITKKTRAIIPVHLYGQCADMDPIIKIAKRHDLVIIEDAAQAIGAMYKGRKAGAMGEIGALSFFPSKNLGAFGDAGMIVTNDKELADKVRILRVHGSAVRYVHSVIGTNSRLDNIQAAILRVKLKYLDKWLEARRQVAKYYNDGLKGLPLVTPYVPAHNVHTYHQYTLKAQSNSDELKAFLLENGIEARTYYPIPLHMQDCYRSLGYKNEDFPESEKAAKHVFSLPIFPELSASQKDYILDRINCFFNDR